MCANIALPFLPCSIDGVHRFVSPWSAAPLQRAEAEQHLIVKVVQKQMSGDRMP
jgi:hypothetical protein